MAIMKCPECKSEVSDKATNCPKCGAPVERKKKTSLLTKLVAGFIALVALSSLFRAFDTLSPQTSATTPSAVPAATPQETQKAEFLKKLDAVTVGLHDMNVNGVTSVAGAGLIADLFSVGADLILESKRGLQLSVPEQAKLAAMRAALIKRQVEVLPIVRRKVGPILNKGLWEADTTARTFGDRYTSVEFVAGEFAAHSRIKAAQEAIEPVLARLRFKHADYKWIASADDYTQYKIDSPPDSAVAKIDHEGATVLVE
jgi:hypothetical protein